MSAYFESLNRRAMALAGRTASRPTHGPVPALGRLAPGAIPPEYAALRERLLAAAGARPVRTVVFAGCEGDEGCTQVVREFGEALASMGLRVLLLDADMRTASLTTALAPRGDNLAELSENARDPEDAPWGNGSLTVVPSPLGLGDKERFLRSPALASWLDQQQQRYDYVLLDFPPLERFADALLVASLCDGTLLVIQPGRTRLQAAVHAHERLARAGARVLGVVLTRVKDPLPVVLRRFLRVSGVPR